MELYGSKDLKSSHVDQARHESILAEYTKNPSS